MPDGYLQMPPEQGGVRFGPLPDQVRLGSDERRCHVLMEASWGIAPLHARLQRTDRGWELEPTRDAWVEMVPPGGAARRVRQTTLLSPGSQLILGRSSGPKFLLVSEEATGAAVAGALAPGLPVVRRLSSRRRQADEPQAVAGAAPLGTRSLVPAGGAIAQEVARQTSSRVLARSPAAQHLQRLRARVAGGRWKSPELVAAVAIALLLALVSGGSLLAVAWTVLGR